MGEFTVSKSLSIDEKPRGEKRCSLCMMTIITTNQSINFKNNTVFLFAFDDPGF